MTKAFHLNNNVVKSLAKINKNTFLSVIYQFDQDQFGKLRDTIKSTFSDKWI